MKLRGIEMQGFKSFADRTKLTFDDGVTAIVGPNGSGKSNISDAVKWVFGEQSVKSLRGAKMEDVIFGGTHTRSALGYAWVSLFIDNSAHEIAVDADEVVITRRLYRSGESEYKINGTGVRLKDVHEAFMDTGLGRDGYSIIEQGKIADIVSAKSGNRRDIFEEAAGISRFRYRKLEAERDLARAEDNLVRLRDIIGELESRVEPLRVQSEKAKKYVVIASEKKSLEISLWLDRLDKLKTQTRDQDDKILLATADHNAAQKKLDEIDEQLGELTRKSQETSVYIEYKRSQIRDIQERIGNAAVDIAVKENDMRHNEETSASLQKELEVGSGGTDFDAVIGAKRAELQGLLDDAEVQRAAMEAQKAKLEARRRTAQEAVTRGESIAMQRQEIQDSIGVARVSGETSTTLIAETLARLEQIKSQSREKDEGIERLREEYARSKAFADELRERLTGLENTSDGCRIKLNGKNSAIADIQQKQREYERAAGEKLQRAQLIADMEKNLEGFSQSVRSVMKQASAGALRGIIGPLSSLIEVDSKYSVAVEIALGAAMQNIVTADESAAKRAIALLRDSKVGRATFMPVTNIKGNPISEPRLSSMEGFVGIASELVGCEARYRNIVDYSLGRIIVAEELGSAADIAKAFGYRYRVVTLDGQVVNTGGSLTGGYVSRGANLLSRKGEIDALTAQAKEITSKSAELEKQLSALNKEAAEIQAILDGAGAEAKTAGEDLITAQGECKRLSLAIEDAEKLAESSLAETSSLANRIQEFKDKEVSSGLLIAELTASLEKLAGEAADCVKLRDDAYAEADALAADVSSAQVHLAELSKDCDASRELLSGLEAQKADYAARTEQTRERIAQITAQNETISAEIERIRLEAEQGRADIEAMNDDITEAIKQKDDCEARTVALRQQEKSAITQREVASNDLVRLSEQLSSVTAESDDIIAKMWDEYELTKSDAAQCAIPIEDTAAAAKRLTELRNKIRNLGTVNLAAIEEYEEVSGRYTFLRRQIDDVENSKAELVKLIGGLSSEMSEIFEDRFARISEQFGRVFVELFGGGSAALTLSDPSDPLESGIDIEVHPPGKVIKQLMALSGGEQALVAICIYFAILKVSPAPFVLMDEIETALDDVNVAKFAAYLHRMTDDTQFLAITHKRGTMEAADALYGVTMEEKGISKVLRLNISELGTKFRLE